MVENPLGFVKLNFRKESTNPEDFAMRQRRTAQISIFEIYSEHEHAKRLQSLSRILDDTPQMLDILEADLINQSRKNTGRCGLTVENILRCLLLKQQLQVSYDQLAFHLSDSMTYRTFVRLDERQEPKRSSLQATIRAIRPDTLEKLHQLLIKNWLESGDVSFDQLRIDSTVVKSNIAPPSDSQLINDGVRVLSRDLAKCRDYTGVKIRFVDQRRAAKCLSFQIFNAKKVEKMALYPDLLRIAQIVCKQVDRALSEVKISPTIKGTGQWLNRVEHYRDLMEKVIFQTRRRVIDGEEVPSSDKIVSLFEPHTDVIVKGFRDVQYGHKINLSSDVGGFITYLSIEDGNPADSTLCLPVLSAHQEAYNILPSAFVADGAYASQENVTQARQMGVKRAVFNKKRGLTYHAMGVKKKTYKALSDFRAGIEGNISELKRAYGAAKARWKGLDGFKAFVWSSALSYNLNRMARLKLE